MVERAGGFRIRLDTLAHQDDVIFTTWFTYDTTASRSG
jgi:hypothetical protein